MKAVCYERYGGPEVLHLATLPKPVPAENEVLVKIHATTVTSGDRRLRSMDMPLGFGMLGRVIFGVIGPRNKVLGSEFAGRVESVGGKVTRYAVGDEVFGMCGLSMGCYAEYRCISETGAMTVKPENLSYGQAATLSFGGTTALDYLRRARLRVGEKVLVNGASGCVGSATVQLARLLGAQVTGVCSQANAAFVKSAGAHRTINYMKEDYSRRSENYDIIVDTIGNASVSRSLERLTENGRLLLVAANVLDMMKVPVPMVTSSKRIFIGPAAERVEDIRLLGDLASKGLLLPTVDVNFRLEDIVEAHRYVDTGRKKGSVVIEVV